MIEPCENCLILPMCRNQLWHRVVQKCQLLTDYLIKETKKGDNESYIECPIYSLGKSYFVHHVYNSNKIYVSGYKDLNNTPSKKWRNIHGSYVQQLYPSTYMPE